MKDAGSLELQQSHLEADDVSELTPKESIPSMSFAEESATTLEEKSFYKFPTAFGRSLSTIQSYNQMKRTNQMADCHLKIVLVGDEAIGKTSLLLAYVKREFPDDCKPIVFENYATKIKGPQGKIIELALWDTAGQEGCNRLRPLSYADVDIVMVCYAVNDKASVRNVKDLWIPEVKHFCYDTPIMLVGLKSDLYTGGKLEEGVDPKEVDLLAKEVGAFVHVQCSAKNKQNVDNIFKIAMNTTLHEYLYGPKEMQTLLKVPFKKKTRKMKSHNKSPDTATTKLANKTKCVIL